MLVKPLLAASVVLIAALGLSACVDVGGPYDSSYYSSSFYNDHGHSVIRFRRDRHHSHDYHIGHH